MQRAIHILLIVAVIWCGAHLFMPDHVVADLAVEACVEAAPASGDAQDTPAGPAKSDHVSHHHCPIAPERTAGADEGALFPSKVALFAMPAAVLRSRSQAPPLQPPAA